VGREAPAHAGCTCMQTGLNYDGVGVSWRGTFRPTRTAAAYLIEQCAFLFSIIKDWARLGAKRHSTPGTSWVCILLKGRLTCCGVVQGGRWQRGSICVPGWRLARPRCAGAAAARRGAARRIRRGRRRPRPWQPCGRTAEVRPLARSTPAPPGGVRGCSGRLAASSAGRPSRRPGGCGALP